MAYRYLGYGITNDKGIAKLEFDANGNPIDHSYTGTGAGEIDVVASLDDNTHISERSIQSETYEILDCIYYDDSTNNTGATVRMNKTTSDGKSVLTATGDNAHWIFKQNSRAFTLPLIIEFDVDTITTTNDPALNINDGTHDYFVWITNNGHYKFSVSQDGVTKLDGSVNFDKSGSLPTDNAVRLSFLLRTNGDTITYDNLEIYPI